MGYNTRKMCEIKFTALMHTNYRTAKNSRTEIAEQEKINKAKLKQVGPAVMVYTQSKLNW